MVGGEERRAGGRLLRMWVPLWVDGRRKVTLLLSIYLSVDYWYLYQDIRLFYVTTNCSLYLE